MRLTPDPEKPNPYPREATWRSGYAADCKSVHTGSIPVVASNPFKGLPAARSTLSQDRGSWRMPPGAGVSRDRSTVWVGKASRRSRDSISDRMVKSSDSCSR